MSVSGPKEADGARATALVALARSPEKLTAYRLWSALGERGREEAVRVVLEGACDHVVPEERDALFTALASAFHFRERTFRSWPAGRVARDYGAHFLPHRRPELLLKLLRTLHLCARTELLADLLDRLDISHRNGSVDEEAFDDPPEMDRVAEAADALVEHHGLERTLAYFLTLVLTEDPLAPGIEAWLLDRFAEAEEPGRPSEGEEAVKLVAEREVRLETEEAPGDTEHEGPPPERIEATDEFTSLDRLMVYAVTDVAQGVEGSLTEDQLEDAVEELVTLNGRRHRSFFHAGLMDAELDRRPREELPAQNRERLLWYWAGYVTGLARRERHAEIARHFDEQGAVRELGRGPAPERTGGGPAHVAARLVFEALCRVDRPGEATGFLGVDTIVANPLLGRSLLREGTRLLREDRAAEARGIFDLLGEAVRRFEALGVDTDRGLFLEIRRRRAHCHRQMGEPDRARALLERLLEEERDPAIRAMVHADLGLLRGGFRRLADLRLPVDRERVGPFLEALERGEEDFRLAVGTGARYAGHGHYGLGVLALLRESFGEAVDRLDAALSLFESDPERYRAGDLLANARAYLGFALALDLRTERMERATELVRRGLREAASVPRYFVADTLEAIAMKDPSLGVGVAEVLLGAEGPEILDLLLETGPGRTSPAVTEALLSRATDDERAEHERARDLRRVLPLLLDRERHEEAARVLDLLESLAHRGVGREAFLALLEDPASYEPAWDAESVHWARIQALEAAGRYGEASSLLEDHFHRILSGGGYGHRDEAEGVLERIGSYGGDTAGGRLETLRARLEALGRETEGAVNGAADATARGTADGSAPGRGVGSGGAPRPLRVRVLFVGGDERQREHAERLRRELEEEGTGIAVTFLPTGWGSNWSHDLERARTEAERHDAVVLMRFIRTEFGRQFRKSLGSTPWRPCTAAGYRRMRASVLEAARAGRALLRRREEEVRAGLEGG